MRKSCAKDKPVVFRLVDVEEERVGLDDLNGDAGRDGQTLVAPETIPPEGEGDGLDRLQHERVGAAIPARGDDDLRFAAAGGGHSPHILCCQVGHIGGQDQNFGCAACRGVAGRLGEGGVELWFRFCVIGAAGGRRRRVRCGFGAGGRSCAWLTFFGQRVAAGVFGRCQRVAVAADDEDLGVKMGLVDG